MGTFMQHILDNVIDLILSLDLIIELYYGYIG